MLKPNGFTLIELMISVVIIGVLSTFAVMQYQNYIVRSQLTTAIAELNGARTQYELIMNNGANNSSFTVLNMSFSTDSKFCDYIVHAPIGGVSRPALECELKGVSTILLGESVFLNREAVGTWKCSTTAGIDDKYKPIDCI